MNVTDPIADMLTRIRNAVSAKHQTVDVPYSKVKNEIANILLKEGYITELEIVEDGSHKNIRITLKYVDSKSVIQGLKRISKPGLRVYVKKDELPRVLNGLGVAIVSTSRGVMSDRSARKENLGGEILAFVW